ncbi:peptidylprolyl isomerase [Bythopirellula goksoeyrii]|uniref:Peptidyl-prolyl cis-trans isomerase A n=1 Tax=Bythopirellula goksoeyrii TaxID=1400387 RepID=A0A5B9QAS6_9BACT|nr:peptidylprolyl isomerase [Bythopirellula goksoeyrii]QEG34582.1 Peptidyl-prolyl cis-trans isomerase A precursor [Bythopirellula goksoeyrii]
MIRHLAWALALGLFATTNLSAQTIRFDTNVGTFDMRLNPTGNPFLQGNVDNILAYVNAGRYDTTVINRAATNFVLQMGGFQANTLSLPESFNEFPSVPTFDPVIVDEDGDGQVDFDLGGLSNTRGTVSLALSGNPTNPNSGTSSFFINLNDTNDFLDDSGFVPFAEIVNMETVNLIMALPQQNLDPSGGNLGAINIPVLQDNHLVIIERAFVVPTPEAIIASSSPAANSSAASSSSGGPAASTATDLAVPEPNTLLLAAGAMMMLALRNRKRTA